MSDLTLTVTVGELQAFLASLPLDTEVRLAGTANVGLMGWTVGDLGGQQVVLLAFDAVP